MALLRSGIFVLACLIGSTFLLAPSQSQAARPECSCWSVEGGLEGLVREWASNPLVGALTRCRLNLARNVASAQISTTDPTDGFSGLAFRRVSNQINANCSVVRIVNTGRNDIGPIDTMGGVSARCRADVRRLCDAIDDLITSP